MVIRRLPGEDGARGGWCEGCTVLGEADGATVLLLTRRASAHPSEEMHAIKQARHQISSFSLFVAETSMVRVGAHMGSGAP